MELHEPVRVRTAGRLAKTFTTSFHVVCVLIALVPRSGAGDAVYEEVLHICAEPSESLGQVLASTRAYSSVLVVLPGRKPPVR